jgi:hypothetical protein
MDVHLTGKALITYPPNALSRKKNEEAPLPCVLDSTGGGGPWTLERYTIGVYHSSRAAVGVHSVFFRKKRRRKTMELMPRGMEESMVSVWYRFTNRYPCHWPKCC